MSYGKKEEEYMTYKKKRGAVLKIKQKILFTEETNSSLISSIMPSPRTVNDNRKKKVLLSDGGQRKRSTLSIKIPTLFIKGHNDDNHSRFNSESNTNSYYSNNNHMHMDNINSIHMNSTENTCNNTRSSFANTSIVSYNKKRSSQSKFFLKTEPKDNNNNKDYNKRGSSEKSVKINRLLLANMNKTKLASMSNQINKSNIRRSSILDKLMFKIIMPDADIEDYYQNYHSDKYIVLKRQLMKESNRMTGMINDIKKTQSMNESLVKVYMAKLKWKRYNNTPSQ